MNSASFRMEQGWWHQIWRDIRPAPAPEDFPSYLPHSLVLEYFRMYAQHFDLLRHIRFQVSGVPKPHGEKSHQ